MSSIDDEAIEATEEQDESDMSDADSDDYNSIHSDSDEEMEDNCFITSFLSLYNESDYDESTMKSSSSKTWSKHGPRNI